MILFILGFPGDSSSPDRQASGAYFFRPLTSNPLPVSDVHNRDATVTITGPRLTVVKR